MARRADRALIAGGPVPTNAQRQALVALGQDVLDRGLDLPDAARDLLLRRSPRVGNHVEGAPLQTMRLQERGEAGAALDGLLERLPTLRPEDRPPLLELAASLAEGSGLADDARTVRRRLVAEYPRSNEAPAALLERIEQVVGSSGKAERKMRAQSSANGQCTHVHRK